MSYFIFVLLYFKVHYCISDLIDTSVCGMSKGCWAAPPNCMDGFNNTLNCDSVVTWENDPSRRGVYLEIEGKLTDLKSSPFTGKYVALGFSMDDKMGDDSVIDCIAKPDGTVAAYLSFNDETYNFRLYEASNFMLKQVNGTMVNGRVVCRLFRLYTVVNEVPQGDQFKVFDLKDKSYTLEVARGETRKGDYLLGIHGMEDGPLYPWLSSETVNVADTKIVTKMKQTDIPRFVQYNLVKVHGIFMIFGWWICGSIAILFARFFKLSWPGAKFFGTAVWFQFHRGLMVSGLILQCIAFAFVFIQAGDFKMCTYFCDPSSYDLKLHTILGVTCTAAALVQPFMAWLRPAPTNPKRPVFNWLHWFVGTASWIIACITIFLSPTLGKAGLRRNFGYKPDYLMAGYVCSFILTSILLEIVSVCYYRPNDEYSSVPMMALNGAKTMTSDKPLLQKYQLKFDILQTTILLLFVLLSVGICITLAVMIALNHFI